MRNFQRWVLIFRLSHNKLTQNSREVDTTKIELPQKVGQRNFMKDYMKNYRTFASSSQARSRVPITEGVVGK